MDYYKEVYGLNIKNNKQPLLLVEKAAKKQIAKGGKEIEKIIEYIYLIPELVSPTGMTDEQRADHATMKALAPYTKLNPSERIKKCAEMVERINKTKGLIEIKAPKRLEGYCLQKPDLVYTGARIQPDNKGNIKHRGVLKEPFNFTDWIFVYSVGKNEKRDNDEADDAVSLMENAAKSYGVKLKNPGFLTIYDNGL